MAVASFTSRIEFNPRKIVQRSAAAKRRAGIRTGALVRKIAQRSIRKPRRKRPSELTPFARKARDRRRKRLARRGQRIEPLGPAPAEPGQPPRNQLNRLRPLILFAYDDIHEVTVIGPKVAHGRTAGEIEKNNPFMRPAVEAAAPNLPPAFRNALAR
jgi:hypothetical protein